MNGGVACDVPPSYPIIHSTCCKFHGGTPPTSPLQALPRAIPHMMPRNRIYSIHLSPS